MNRPIVLAFVAALTFASCATPTSYGPAKSARGYGFSEQQLGQNQFRIQFRGNAATPRDVVEDYLLYRASELTLQEGCDYFVLSEYDTEAQKTYSATSYSPAYYGRSLRRPGRRGGYAPFPYYAYGFDWGYPRDVNVREITRYSAIAYVALHEGAKAESNPKAFDAREVMENLGPLVQVP